MHPIYSIAEDGRPVVSASARFLAAKTPPFDAALDAFSVLWQGIIPLPVLIVHDLVFFSNPPKRHMALRIGWRACFATAGTDERHREASTASLSPGLRLYWFLR